MNKYRVSFPNGSMTIIEADSADKALWKAHAKFPHFERAEAEEINEAVMEQNERWADVILEGEEPADNF